MTPRPLTSLALAALACSAVAGCAAPASDLTSARGTGSSSTVPGPAAPPAEPSAAGTSAAPADPSGETTAGRAVPTPSSSPLSLPAGPAVVLPPPPPPAPGSLAALDWRAHDHEGACAGAEVGEPVRGDLAGDGTEEVAVPLTCPGSPRTTSRLLVYAGDAASPRLLGDALPPEERSALHGAEVRDGFLVVTATTSSDPAAAEPDTAVTARWTVRDGALVRTDRWTDPVHVLETDAH